MSSFTLTPRPVDLSGSTAGRRFIRRDKRGRRIGYNWWREYNCRLLSEAEVSWQALRESGQAIGTSKIAGADGYVGYYQLSEAEYRLLRPRPTLKAFLIANTGMGARRLESDNVIQM